MDSIDIIVKNAHSPGAKLSDSNNQSILFYYEEVMSSPEKRIAFIEFKKHIAQKYNTSEGNDRTIYPFLRELGFVQYDDDIVYGSFFTTLGMMYVKLIQAAMRIHNCSYIPSKQKDILLEHLTKMISYVVYRGVWVMLAERNTANYRSTLLSMIRYLLRYDTIDKNEFAYMLSCESNPEISQDSIKDNILKYRNGQLQIHFMTDVKEKRGGFSERTQKKGSFSCYSYLINLLNQSGIVYKKEKTSEAAIGICSISRYYLSNSNIMKKSLYELLDKAGIKYV